MVVGDVLLELRETDVVPMNSLVINLSGSRGQARDTDNVKGRRTWQPVQALRKSDIHCWPLGREDMAGEANL